MSLFGLSLECVEEKKDKEDKEGEDFRKNLILEMGSIFVYKTFWFPLLFILFILFFLFLSSRILIILFFIINILIYMKEKQEKRTIYWKADGHKKHKKTEEAF